MMKRTLRYFRYALIVCSALTVTGGVAALANYAATQGAGTTFGSIVIGGVHFVSSLLCDATVANQCAAVSAAGNVATSTADGASVTLGAKADAKSPATDTTAITAMQVWKQISSSVQSLVTNSTPLGGATAANSLPVVPAPATANSGALTGVTCGSAASSCVLKNAPGNFFGAYAECTSPCWLMVFNSTAAPSNGATTAGVAANNLVECVNINGNSSGSISYPTFPVNYTTGITAAISSTACATLTLSAVGFIRGTVM